MKKLTLGSILKLGSALLALIAFFLMFAPQLKLGDNTIDYVLWGHKESLGMVSAEVKGAVGSGIGYILTLLGAIGAALSVFLKKGKLIGLISAAVLLVSAILIFLVKPMYLGANGVDSTDSIKVAAAPIIAGIFALLGAGATALASLKK